MPIGADVSFRPKSHDPLSLLGGLSPAQFLERHWQKEPLLVRGAMPGFSGLLSPDELAALACDPAFHPRVVVEHPGPPGSDWELHEGPFVELDLDALPESRCTLLVPGVERAVDGAWELLQRFSFVPYARIDDLMVSWARPGGSVGPHTDLYDVFLLQGPGRRRWQISRQEDRTLVERQPIDVLARFAPDDEWVLEPGDMLYLPPGVAHYGVAVDECMTYSIGFLAPTRQALVENFLGYLAETLELEGIYQDPALAPQEHPGELPSAMIDDAVSVLERIRWTRDDVAEFLGRLLTGPKPGVEYAPPSSPLGEAGFRRKLASKGSLALAPASRALFHRGALIVNGVAFPADEDTLAALRPLADDRVLPLPVVVWDEGARLLHRLYVEGWIRLASR